MMVGEMGGEEGSAQPASKAMRGQQRTDKSEVAPDGTPRHRLESVTSKVLELTVTVASVACLRYPVFGRH